MIDLASLPLWIYAAVGSTILWAKMKANQRAVYGLTDLVAIFVPKEWPRVRGTIEILIYLSLGTLITIAVINPGTPAQAFAAGLGWTGLTTK
jgi:hypothetical protein